MCYRNASKPFDCVVIDTVGPLPTSANGNKYLVTMMCNLTKYIVIAPTVNKEAQSVAKVICEQLILVYGPFKILLTDLGTEYINEIFKELTNILQIQHRKP